MREDKVSEQSFLAHTGDAGLVVIWSPVLVLMMLLMVGVLAHQETAHALRESVLVPLFSPMGGWLEHLMVHCSVVWVPMLLATAHLWGALTERWWRRGRAALLQNLALMAFAWAMLSVLGWMAARMTPGDWARLFVERLPECWGATLAVLGLLACQRPFFISSVLRWGGPLRWLARPLDALICAPVNPHRAPHRLRWLLWPPPGHGWHYGGAAWMRPWGWLFPPLAALLAALSLAADQPLALLWLPALYLLCASGQNYRRICGAPEAKGVMLY